MFVEIWLRERRIDGVYGGRCINLVGWMNLLILTFWLCWILVRCHFPRFVCLYCAHYCLLANGRNQPHIYFLSWNFLCLYSWIWDDPRCPLRLFITYVWVQRKYCPSWLLFFLFSKLFLWPLVSFNITPLSSLSQRVGSVLYMNLSFNPAVSIARGLCVN